MHLIEQNPYRVLGMFANDSLRVMTANISRIRAYNKVGKEIHFPCDHTEIFGKIDRSESAIQKAISQLADPIEAKTWQLLWIHSNTDNILEIDVDTPSIQADINNAVIALNDYRAQKKATEYWGCVFNREVNILYLFDNGKFWNDKNEKSNVAKGFIEKLVPTISHAIFRPGCYEGWFWWFRMNTSDSSLLGVIKAKYKGFAFERLDMMAKDYNYIAPSGQRYRSLLWDASPYLSILNTFGTFDPESFETHYPEDIQIAKNNFAICLMKFCEMIYQRSKYWKSSQLDDMIDFLFEDVRDLVYSSTTSDLLEERIDTLRERMRYLAPDECEEEAFTIHSLIEAFCDRENSARWALWLIRQCVASLLSIRDTLGKDNIYYRHISTKIADNAIYSADEDLSKAERMRSNPANDERRSTAHLQETIRRCRVLMCDIELLDLEEDFLNGKFAAYKKHVTEAALKHGPLGEEIGPDISMITEADEYEACGDNYAKLREYARTHPYSKFYPQAVTKIHAIEDAAWPKEATVAALMDYKRKFPDSHNENKIIEVLDKLLLGDNYGTIEEYRTMLQLFSSHPKAQEIHNRIEWLIFAKCVTIIDYRKYLEAYPSGLYTTQAENLIKLLEKKKKEIKEKEILAAYLRCKTISDFYNFMDTYPTSDLCEKAHLRIEDLYWEEAERTGDYQAYLSRYPKGIYHLIAYRRMGHTQEKEPKGKEYSSFNSRNNFTNIQDNPNGRFHKNADEAANGRKRKISIPFLTFISVGIVVFVLLLVNLANILFFSSAATSSEGETVILYPDTISDEKDASFQIEDTDNRYPFPMEDSTMENLKETYRCTKRHFQVPDFDTFCKDIQDIDKRRRLYQNLNMIYSMPDFDVFSQNLGFSIQPAPNDECTDGSNELQK